MIFGVILLTVFICCIIFYVFIVRHMILVKQDIEDLRIRVGDLEKK